MSKDVAEKEKPEESTDAEEQNKAPSPVKLAKQHVRQRFEKELEPVYLFHNFAYSEEIADKVEELAELEGVDEATRERLIITAWFYPVGYIGGSKNWADRSVEELQNWAKQEHYDLRGADQWIPEAKDATLESSLEARLLHDAAWSWFGRKRYDRRSNLLQLEREALEGKDGDPVAFGNKMKQRLLTFNYLTAAGTREFDNRRRRNVADQQSDNYKIQQKEVKAKTGKNFGRSVDTMYRTAFRNHINLSRIADGKANMMISINTIILSVLLAVSGAGLTYFEDLFFEAPEFLVPIITIMLSSLIAVVFAVFSARPSVTEYQIKKQKLIKSNEASLLYFGNFLKLEKQDFVDYLHDIKYDQGETYDDLSRDLYDLGQVLHKKYLLLTISYNTFVGGLALAVISFMVVYLLNVL